MAINKKLPQVKIVSNPGRDKHVYIDGFDVPGVRKVSFELTADKIPELKLEFSACDVEINGEFIPRLPEVLEGWYKPVTAEEFNLKQIYKEMIRKMNEGIDEYNLTIEGLKEMINQPTELEE